MNKYYIAIDYMAPGIEKQADSIHITEHNTLIGYKGKEIIWAYPPGTWLRVTAIDWSYHMEG